MKYNIFHWSMVSPIGIVENRNLDLDQTDLSHLSSPPWPERIKYIMMMMH